MLSLGMGMTITCHRFIQTQNGLTMRAADGGYAARFSSFFVALGFSRFEGESTLPPTAANASRWAPGRNTVGFT
jgi:hypothetical protein